MPNPRKILVVDDEKDINEALSEILSAQGHKMFTAFDGEEAIKTIKGETIDLILLDIRMPKVDGLAVIRAVKQHTPKTKIIVITGFGDSYIDKVKELGVDGFFVKPVRLEAIIKRMKELLEEKSPPSWSWKAKAEDIGNRILKARLLFVESPLPKPPFIPLDDLIQSGKMQFETQICYCQDEALNKLGEFKPDIVIIAMSVPKDGQSKEAASTSDLTDEILERIKKGTIKSVIVHSRRDVLEEEHKDKLDQLYNEMKDVPELELDDFSPQGRRRHIEKLKAKIIEACLEKELFIK